MKLIIEGNQELELDIYIDKRHTCDSYVVSGFNVTEDCELTEEDLNWVETHYEGPILEWIMEWSGGYRD